MSQITGTPAPRLRSDGHAGLVHAAPSGASPLTSQHCIQNQSSKGALPGGVKQDLRGKLAIGVHRNVEVTRVQGDSPRVSQALCSALPVACSPIPSSDWEAVARLILEAASEATLLAAAADTNTNSALLTRLGGNTFGNHDDWG